VSQRTNTLERKLMRRESDLLETGTRELTGEWVVGTDVWRRLKSQRRSKNDGKRATSTSRLTTNNVSRLGRMALNGLGAIRGSGRDSPDMEMDNDSVLGKKGGAEKVIYYIHGGAYYVGNAATHRLITIGVSKACNARVFGMSYIATRQQVADVQQSHIDWLPKTYSHFHCTTSYMATSDS
jgi:acetyl esterase/lipase